MSTHHDRQRRGVDSGNGSVLVVVMLVSGILLIAATAMMALAMNASHRTRLMTVDTQALNVAEAGIADMIGKMTPPDDYWSWVGQTFSTNFPPGSDSSYRVTVRLATNQATGNANVLISSVGTVGGISRATTVELLGTPRDINDDRFSLNGAILAGGDVRFRTAAFAIKGNVHSNQEITSQSGAHNGDFLPADGATECYITAVGGIGNLQGTHETGVVPRELPEFNFDSYRQLAIDNGIYIDGDINERHWNPAPPNGIIYVNGNARIRGNSSLNGTLVVNGNVRFENNYSSGATIPGMPAVLATGNVDMSNRGRIDGLVYAGGNAYINNNVDIDGGIVSVGYTEVNNKTDVFHPSDYPDWDPLQPAIPPEVIVGGWLR